MRKVVNSRQVGHLWANAAQPCAYNSGRSVSFDGPAFYSYRTVIAYRGVDKERPFYFVTSETFSPTTSGKHMHIVWHSIGYGSGRTTFTVPFIPRNILQLEECIAANVAWFRDKFMEALGKANRANVLNKPNALFTCRTILDNATKFIEFFGLNLPEFLKLIGTDSDELLVMWVRAKELSEEHYRKNNTPDMRAKREQVYARRQELKEQAEQRKREEQAAKNAEIIEKWKNGEHVYMPYGIDTYLRIKGDEIQTSRGASFPLEHGLKALPIIRKCAANGGCVFQEHKPKLGHYTLDKVTTTHIYAGCHILAISEIERLAQLINA